MYRLRPDLELNKISLWKEAFFNDGAQKDASHLGECCPSLSQKLSCDLLFKFVVS